MRRVALITDGWKRMFTYAWPAGILQRIRETQEEVNLYIFHSTGNWSRDEGYNRAEYNIFHLPDLKDFDGIILELNNVSSGEVLREVAEKAKNAGVPVVSIANRLEDFYYVGINNYAAMQQVIRHLHEKHQFQSFWFLMGPEDNYESKRRLLGLVDYAREHHLPVTEDQIWHGTFDFRGGKEGFLELWKRNKRLPDAVICVNDNVAVAVCETAAELGFHVPEDFCVTGFDNFDKASFYIPSITTVGHVREDAAATGMEVLLRLWAGEKLPRHTYTSAELICQESCGCRRGTSQDARTQLKNQILDGVDKEEFDKEVLSMEAEMAQCDTVEEMMHCIPQCIPSMKCDAMYLVLDDHINDYKNETEEQVYLDTAPLNAAFSIKGYPKTLRMVFAYEDGRVLDIEKKPLEKIFPTFDSPVPRQSFLFVPLHFGERTVGYMVMRNAVYLMEKHYLFQILHALTRSMENLHKKEMLTYMNKRLNALYIVDQLTGMYSRAGFLQLGEKIFRSAKEGGKRLLLLFADLDRLKYINDNFGHWQGDTAIRMAAQALMECAYEPDPVPARLGGDEFVMLLEYRSEQETRFLLERIVRTLEKKQQPQTLPFRVEMSLGAAVTDPRDEEETLEDYMKKADDRMYREKERKNVNRL